VIRNLRVKAASSRLGQSFQGHAAVRPIGVEAHQLLSEYARELPILETAAIYPEDEFEARLVHDQPVRRLMVRETGAVQSHRLRYLFDTVDVRRARKNVNALDELYGGQ